MQNTRPPQPDPIDELIAKAFNAGHRVKMTFDNGNAAPIVDAISTPAKATAKPAVSQPGTAVRTKTSAATGSAAIGPNKIRSVRRPRRPNLPVMFTEAEIRQGEYDVRHPKGQKQGEDITTNEATSTVNAEPQESADGPPIQATTPSRDILFDAIEESFPLMDREYRKYSIVIP